MLFLRFLEVSRMKKFWLVVIFCSFLFLFPKIANAEEFTFNFYENNFKTNFSSDFLDKLDTLLDIYESRFPNYRYVCSVYNKGIIVYSMQTTENNLFLTFGYAGFQRVGLRWKDFVVTNYNYFPVNEDNIDKLITNINKVNSPLNSSLATSSTDGNIVKIYFYNGNIINEYDTFIYRTNFDHVYYSNVEDSFMNDYPNHSITIRYFDKILNSNDEIFSYYDLNNKPTIKFYTEDVIQNDKLLSTWVYAYFSILDFEKYSYSYRINEKEFIELSESDFEDYVEDDKLLQVFSHKFVNDGSMIVQIRDKVTDEYIAGQSITVSHLGINNPNVVFEEQKYCGGVHQGTIFDSENWNICTRLHFTIEHYELDKHEIFYKIGENGQRIRTYDETTSIDLYENTRVYVYVYDKSTKTGYTFYYDVTTVDPPNVINGPYVESISTYNERENNIWFKLYFINYNSDLYDYYYMIGTIGVLE